jgi:hypothetical protein
MFGDPLLSWYNTQQILFANVGNESRCSEHRKKKVVVVSIDLLSQNRDEKLIMCHPVLARVETIVKRTRYSLLKHSSLRPMQPGRSCQVFEADVFV